MSKFDGLFNESPEEEVSSAPKATKFDNLFTDAPDITASALSPQEPETSVTPAPLLTVPSLEPVSALHQAGLHFDQMLEKDYAGSGMAAAGEFLQDPFALRKGISDLLEDTEVPKMLKTYGELTSLSVGGLGRTLGSVMEERGEKNLEEYAAAVERGEIELPHPGYSVKEVIDDPALLDDWLATSVTGAGIRSLPATATGVLSGVLSGSQRSA